MRLLCIGAVVLALALPAAAVAQTSSYGCSWNCDNDILGSYGNLAAASVTNNMFHSGPRALMVTEAPHDGTPQAYLCIVQGLVDGDVVDASFWGYDVTPAASPSLRIWGSYVDAAGDYVGSAGGNGDYTDGSGWSEVAWSWTIALPVGATGLNIHARLYSTPSTCVDCSTDFFIDSFEVTAPTAANVTLPCYDYNPTPVQATTWGGVKQLY